MVSDPARFMAIARLLRNKSDVLLERWSERVLRDDDVAAAERLPKPALLDHFPALLERLARGLERAVREADRPSLEGARVGNSTASRAHAADRFAVGFTLPEVVRELSHLRCAVLELYEAEGLALDLDANLLIHRSIDEMIAMGAREMARLDKEAIEEQARIAKQEHSRAEEANRLKDMFLATLSHELRTPLNAILGWTRILRTRALQPENYSQALEAIERNAFSQARLVDELLDVSRITSGKLRLQLRPLDLVAAVKGAIEAVRPTAEAKGISVDLQSTGETIIDGDSDRLKQVVWNLLSNAVKFSPRGKRVEVTIESDDQAARVRVVDYGDGIEPEFLDQIFERFHQIDMSPTRSESGLGLGLAIARELVELHKGTVEAQSEGKGKGSTFVVTLPVRSGAARSGT
jgi:signal transduction histidine kinase